MTSRDDLNETVARLLYEADNTLSYDDEVASEADRDWYRGVAAKVLKEVAPKIKAQSGDLLRLQRALFKVDSIHHLNGSNCLCGFEGDARSRTQTEHITDSVLEAYTSDHG